MPLACVLPFSKVADPLFFCRLSYSHVKVTFLLAIVSVQVKARRRFRTNVPIWCRQVAALAITTIHAAKI